MRPVSASVRVAHGNVTLPLSECENRILADANVSCPPAVPLAVCGERLTPEVISAMEYYGTEHCTVVVE